MYCTPHCRAKENPLTHGESGTRLHSIWCHIKARCYCETAVGYEYYGARGIRMYGPWMINFTVFRDWALRNGYEEHLEIDRRNVNGNYVPGNCRWATRKQQMQNTRKRRDAKTSKYKGVSLHSQQPRWIAQVHKDGKPKYVGSFLTEIEAAEAYDNAASQLYGEFVVLNFPKRKPVTIGSEVPYAGTF